MKSYKIYEDQPYSQMIRVAGGKFLLNDKIETEVSAFWIGQYAVSQELWREVMGNNPSRFKGKNLPVEQVSWYDAVEFCNALSKAQGLDAVYKLDKTKKDPNNQSEHDPFKYLVEKDETANGFRLPTEVEWEFAARGGNVELGARYSRSKNLDKVCWYSYNEGHGETQQLGLKVPNELGVYDMLGNVYEWCQDWDEYYSDGRLNDPKGPKTVRFRVLRGGSWGSNELDCQVSRRYSHSPHDRFHSIGIRLSRTAL